MTSKMKSGTKTEMKSKKPAKKRWNCGIEAEPNDKMARLAHANIKQPRDDLYCFYRTKLKTKKRKNL